MRFVGLLALFSAENLQICSEKMEFDAYLALLLRQCDLGYFILPANRDRDVVSANSGRYPVR